MTELATMIPPAIIVLIAAALAAKLPRKIGHAAGIISLLAVSAISLTVEQGTHLSMMAFGTFEIAPFVINEFSAIMGAVFGFLGAAAVLYSYSSEASRKVTSLALTYLASTLGVVFAGDWLTLIFFAELMAVTSTILVWEHGGKAVRAGFRYALFHGIGGSLLLFGIVGHYAATGTFMFAETGIIAGWPSILAVLGIGINCGFIGLHMWLPDTYPKPHFAASVFLSVFTTKTSAYILYRIFPEGGLALAVAFMGGAMAIYGATFALLQHDMRALLSYHIQAQVGYMVAAIGIGAYVGGEVLHMGTVGAIGHLVNNILFKSLLFMVAGVIIYRTGEHDLYKLGGLWKVMPLTAVAFAIGALSITAIPGFNGFISKGIILNAASPEYFGGGNKALYWMLKIGAVGTLLSFIKFGYYAFLHGKSDFDVKDATRGQTIGMLAAGAVCILFGVWWTGFVEMLPHLPQEHHLHPYSASHLKDTLMLTAVSLVGFKLIRKPLAGLGHVPDMDRVIYPAAFYISKASVYVTTEIYGLVDRAVVGTVQALYNIGNYPEEAVVHASQMLPDKMLADHLTIDEKHPSRIALRPGIGASILILVAVLTAVILVMV